MTDVASMNIIVLPPPLSLSLSLYRFPYYFYMRIPFKLPLTFASFLNVCVWNTKKVILSLSDGIPFDWHGFVIVYLHLSKHLFNFSAGHFTRRHVVLISITRCDNISDVMPVRQNRREEFRKRIYYSEPCSTIDI